MQSKIINDAPEKTYVLILETGEEVVSQIQRFARENNLNASRFTAIGAFSSATLGYFDWNQNCLLYTSPSPRDKRQSRMPSSA